MGCTCFENWKFNITEICDDCWDSINNWFGEEMEKTINKL